MADTATKQATAQRQAVDSVSYQDLYRRWENGNWKSTELDFSQDREDWLGFPADERRSWLSEPLAFRGPAPPRGVVVSPRGGRPPDQSHRGPDQLDAPQAARRSPA